MYLYSLKMLSIVKQQGLIQEEFERLQSLVSVQGPTVITDVKIRILEDKLNVHYRPF